MSYAKLKTLVAKSKSVKAMTDDQVAESMESLAQHFGRGKERGRFQVVLVDKKKDPAYCLELSEGQCTVGSQAVGAVEFEIKTTRQTWMEIAKGELSPVDAFLLGRMEVHGDLGFAKRLFVKAAAQGGETEILGA